MSSGTQAHSAKKSHILIKILNIAIVLTLLSGFLALLGIAYTVARLNVAVNTNEIKSTFTGNAYSITIPTRITNNGLLSLSTRLDFSVMNKAGIELLSGSTEQLEIPPGSSKDFLIPIVFDLSKIPRDTLQKLLTNEDTLTLKLNLKASIQLLTLSVALLYKINWGAPLSNLSIGDPRISFENSTLYLTLPVSFMNKNDFISISTRVRAEIYNLTSNELITESTLLIDAPPHSRFSGDFVFPLELPPSIVSFLLFENRIFHLLFVLKGNLSNIPFTIQKPYEFNWGALIGNLKFGSLTSSYFNYTHVKFVLPFSFKDCSSFLSFNGSISGVVLDKNGNKVGTLDTTTILVNPGEEFSGSISGYVDARSLSQKTLVLQLFIKTSIGEVVKEVVLNV